MQNMCFIFNQLLEVQCPADFTIATPSGMVRRFMDLHKLDRREAISIVHARLEAG